MAHASFPVWCRRIAPWVLAILAVGAGTAVFAERYHWMLRTQAIAAEREETTQQTRAVLRLLESELQKFRLLPAVLGEYPDLRAALRSGRVDPALNDKLAVLKDKTGAGAIFALDRQGKTIAASNARLPESFVGHDYNFRPYYRLGWTKGGSEYFALGTVSHRPGLFLSRRIEDRDGPIGVIVVKVEFDAIERAWNDGQALSFVTDANGVLLLSSDPALHFRTLKAIAPARKAQIKAALQFGGAPLTPLGIAIAANGLTTLPDGSPATTASLPVPVAGWQLYHIEPLGEALKAARQRAEIATMLFAVLLSLTVATLGWASVRRRRAAEARARLEQEVALRTRDLAREMEARAVADQRYRQAREELAHANRLGTLGTISAGVAHEINQPVATIRTFAENAAAFLARAQPAQVATNLREIVAMTDRIGSITAQLRRYARRGVGTIGPLPLTQVIDGVRLLVGDRFRSARVRLDLPAPGATLMVQAGRVRLEQVLVNLLTNALEAVRDQPDRWVSVILTQQDGRVILDVRDSGTGVDPAIADQLFMPFTSTKSEGLGLGLHIARDIMVEFGGTLEHVTGDGHTLFRMTLNAV
ncbi:sensor histidine kinase [Novosphingobium sp. Rr 2-17]|uniref:sensor histidine kinase n=1 Tax=Novosphingobium sp. Rr 2-17 TaxID=555793 RepID=UPI00063F588D|nr:ATP-binding protein [Novosphingobium sp. Rr 2-17]